MCVPKLLNNTRRYRLIMAEGQPELPAVNWKRNDAARPMHSYLQLHPHPLRQLSVAFLLQIHVKIIFVFIEEILYNAK